MVIPLRIKRRDFFSTRQHSYFGDSKVQKGPKKIFWRPASPRLSQGLDDRTPPPPPPYLKVWIRHCITRVVFKLGSKVNCVCYGLATPHGDWLLYLTKHGLLFQPKRSKTKTNRDLHAHAWAPCASMEYVIASNSGWLMSLFAPVVIGHSSYFGFSYKTHLTNLWYKLFDYY